MAKVKKIEEINEIYEDLKTSVEAEKRNLEISLKMFKLRAV
jgi:hypothetical protein